MKEKSKTAKKKIIGKNASLKLDGKPIDPIKKPEIKSFLMNFFDDYRDRLK